jgi:RHS repeat-associated protein
VTQFFLTDAPGSVLASFSDTPNSATVLGNQVYGPYGNQRYLKGTIGTAKGYTWQYADPTGLDYYNARYYDPVAGVFLSADTVQGNAQGMNPYAYVAGNPETFTDPSGQYVAGPGGITYIPGAPYYMQGGEAYQVSTPSHPVKDGTPYTGPGIVNGWRPGQGPNVKLATHHSQGGCDDICGQRDKDLLKYYYQQQRNKIKARWNAVGDLTSVAGDILTIIADIGQWGKEILNLISLLTHVGAAIVDLTTAFGGKLPDWLSWLPGFVAVAKPILNTLNSIRGILDLFDPATGWIKNLLNSFAKGAQSKVREGIGLLLSGLGGGTGAIGEGVSSVSYPSDNTVNNYTDAQAHSECQKYYQSGVC